MLVGCSHPTSVVQGSDVPRVSSSKTGMSIDTQGDGYRSKQSNGLIELTLPEGKYIRIHVIERDHKWERKAKDVCTVGKRQ